MMKTLVMIAIHDTTFITPAQLPMSSAPMYRGRRTCHETFAASDLSSMKLATADVSAHSGNADENIATYPYWMTFVLYSPNVPANDAIASSLSMTSWNLASFLSSETIDVARLRPPPMPTAAAAFSIASAASCMPLAMFSPAFITSSSIFLSAFSSLKLRNLRVRIGMMSCSGISYIGFTTVYEIIWVISAPMQSSFTER